MTATLVTTWLKALPRCHTGHRVLSILIIQFQDILHSNWMNELTILLGWGSNIYSTGSPKNTTLDILQRQYRALGKKNLLNLLKIQLFLGWLILTSGLLTSMLCLLANISEHLAGSLFWVDKNIEIVLGWVFYMGGELVLREKWARQSGQGAWRKNNCYGRKQLHLGAV